MLCDGKGAAFGFLDREALRRAGHAKGVNRAIVAGGSPGGAGSLAELHEGGVEGPRVMVRHQGRRPGPELVLSGGRIDRHPLVEEAGEDPCDVGIDDGAGEVEGERGDGTRGVSPESRKGGEGGGIAGEAAVVLVEDGAGRFLEVADPVVVTEPFPGLEELGLGGGSEGLEVGKGREEFFEAPVLADGRHGGLLEHDLRDEDGVGIGGSAPWVVGPTLGKPAQQGVAKGALVAERVLGGGGLGHGRSRIGKCGLLAMATGEQAEA